MILKEMTTTDDKHVTLTEGTGGDGKAIWIIWVDWISTVDGRKKHHQEIFKSLSEAESWFKYSYIEKTGV